MPEYDLYNSDTKEIVSTSTMSVNMATDSNLILMGQRSDCQWIPKQEECMCGGGKADTCGCQYY